MNDLPQGSENGKLRYTIFGRFNEPPHDVYLMREGDCPLDWTFINTFNTRDEARGAVLRYLDARAVAKSMGARLD